MISKINTCGFNPTLYQPIASAYDDNLTYVEFCLNLAKTVNGLIDEVNTLGTTIYGFDDRIKEIEGLVDELNGKIGTIQTQLATKVNYQEFETGLNNLKTELQNLIIENYETLKEYTDAQDANLQYQIDNFAVENIKLYDPTTGLLSTLQTVIDNIFDSTRDEAISASEYDGLEITATDYDALEISAIDYDRYGKTILAS